MNHGAEEHMERSPWRLGLVLVYSWGSDGSRAPNSPKSPAFSFSFDLTELVVKRRCYRTNHSPLPGSTQPPAALSTRVVALGLPSAQQQRHGALPACPLSVAPSPPPPFAAVERHADSPPPQGSSRGWGVIARASPAVNPSTWVAQRLATTGQAVDGPASRPSERAQ
jgi:hypothetical protein